MSKFLFPMINLKNYFFALIALICDNYYWLNYV